MLVKFILPAFPEAKSPYWRPIKYSLFPPLGLATLAAYLTPDDEAIIQDESVETLLLNDTPELAVIQVSIHYQMPTGLTKLPTTTGAAAHSWFWAAYT